MPTILFAGTMEAFYPVEAEVEDAKEIRPCPPAPLLPVAIGLVVGIAGDALWALQTATCVSGIVAAGLVMCLPVRRRWVRSTMLGLAAAAGGAALHAAHFRRLPDDHIAHFLSAEPMLVSLTGHVVRAPWVVASRRVPFTAEQRDAKRSKFVLSVEEAETERGPTALRGLVAVTVGEPLYDVFAGDRVRVFGKLFQPARPDNPGEINWGLIQRRQGICAGLISEFPEAIEKLPPLGNVGLRLLSRFRLEAQTLLLEETPGEDQDGRNLIGALILGQRAELDPAIIEAFRRTGTLHFLALSGMHIGMLGLSVWFVGRVAGLGKQFIAAVVLLVLLLYSLVVEPSPSVFRASLIGLALCAGYLFRAPVNSLNSMCLAAIVLLWWQPLQLFHPGFQLSFVVTLGIIYLTPLLVEPLEKWLRPPSTTAAAEVMGRKIGVGSPVDSSVRELAWRGIQRWVRRTIVYSLSVSLVAWLVGTPLAAFHFNALFTYGWPFTVLISPFMFVTMMGGFLKLALGVIWPSTGLVTGPLLTVAGDALVWVVQVLARTPAAMIDLPRPPVWWLLLYYSLLVGLVVRCGPNSTRPLGRRGRGWAATAVLLFIAALPYCHLPRNEGELRMTILSVGAGSATILELPGGEVWLYDAGSQGDYDVGRMTILPALREQGIRRIDTVIVSHPNYDHYSGLVSLSEHVDIERLLITPHFERFCKPGEADHRMLEHMRARGIEIHYLYAGEGGRSQVEELPSDVGLEVLWPPSDLPAETTSNDTSLVIRLTHGGHSVLLTGDIEGAAQEQLLASSRDLRGDVLVLPHHGAVIPTTSRFVDRVQPRYALRSSNRRTVRSESSKIEKVVAGRGYLNTADVGAITVILRPEELVVEGFHEAPVSLWDEAEP